VNTSTVGVCYHISSVRVRHGVSSSPKKHKGSRQKAKQREREIQKSQPPPSGFEIPANRIPFSDVIQLCATKNSHTVERPYTHTHTHTHHNPIALCSTIQFGWRHPIHKVFSPSFYSQTENKHPVSVLEGQCDSIPFGSRQCLL
jgi:hypothetical protein